MMVDLSESSNNNNKKTTMKDNDEHVKDNKK